MKRRVYKETCIFQKVSVTFCFENSWQGIYCISDQLYSINLDVKTPPGSTFADSCPIGDCNSIFSGAFRVWLNFPAVPFTKWTWRTENARSTRFRPPTLASKRRRRVCQWSAGSRTSPNGESTKRVGICPAKVSESGKRRFEVGLQSMKADIGLFLIWPVRFLITVTQNTRSQGSRCGLSRMLIWRRLA